MIKWIRTRRFVDNELSEGAPAAEGDGAGHAAQELLHLRQVVCEGGGGRQRPYLTQCIYQLVRGSQLPSKTVKLIF